MENPSACTDERIIARIVEFSSTIRSSAISGQPLSALFLPAAPPPFSLSLLFFSLLVAPSLSLVHSEFLYVAAIGDWMGETIAQRRPLRFRFLHESGGDGALPLPHA